MEQKTTDAERFVHVLRRMNVSCRRAGRVDQITHGGFAILLLLHRHEMEKPDTPLRIGELGERMEQPVSAISRWVGELEKGGLLRRFSGSDRRTVCVELTEQGRRMLEQSWEQVLGTVETMLFALGSDGPKLIELLERADSLLRAQNGDAL